jgi:hypothetical protein
VNHGWGSHTGTKDGGALGPKSVVHESVFVPTAIIAVDLVIKRRVNHMQLEGADADNGACSNMESDTQIQNPKS